MKKPFLSLCTIFRDAEDFLPEFLDCLCGMVDELILVDTGSRDNSLNLLRERNIPWLSFNWVNDFSQAKNFAMSQAKGEWLLLLDVDERLRSSDICQLREILQKEDTTEAIYLPCINLQSGDWKGAYQVRNVQYIVRLVRNAGFTYRYAIHEQIEDSVREKGQGIFRKLELPLFHLGLHEDFFSNKVDRNLRIIREKYQAEPENPYYMYYYADVIWSDDLAVLDILKSAFIRSKSDFRYQIGLRILEWLREFYEHDPYLVKERDFFESELLQLSPKSAIVYLRLARDAFDNQDIEAAIQAYEIVQQGVFSELVNVAEQQEVFDRLGVLYAMKGAYAQALDCFKTLRRLFGNNCGVYHQLLKTAFISRNTALLAEFAQDIPADIGALERGKLQEILTLLSRANFPGSMDIMHKITNMAGLSLRL